MYFGTVFVFFCYFVDLTDVDWLNILFILGKQMLQLFIYLTVRWQFYEIRFRWKVQKHNFLFLHILNHNNLTLLKIILRQIFKLVRPKTNLNSFKLIPNYHTDHLLSLLRLSKLLHPIKWLFLNILNYSYNIHILILNIVILMLPMIVLL